MGEWAGTHPLSVWGAGLLVVLAATWAARLAVGRAAPRCAPWVQRIARPNGPAALAATMAISAVLLLGCAHVLVMLAEEWAGDATGVAALDQSLADTLRATASVGTLTLFAWLTHAGDKITLAVLAAVVLALLWWRGHRMLATGWAVALAGNGLLTRAFKHSFERVRPVHTHEVAVADGFSFPSGHSSSSMVAYGMLAYIALRLLPVRWHLPALLLAAATVFTVGWSRVVLQVHFASDVLAGWITGGAWLACCLLVMRGATHWRRCRASAITNTNASTNP
ncbi:MAG: phosphatase PAP2 family protein [Comamonadaceae bacterium]|nr:MAG: phosphatase PAP2 family protein [Comamonadaceae bacterium]